MNRLRIAFVACGIAAACVGYGCGESQHTLSRDQLVAKAEAICTRSNTTRNALNKNEQGPSAFGSLVVAVGNVERTAATELDRLVPPASFAEEWRKIVADDRTIANYTIKYGQYAKSHDQRSMRSTLRESGVVIRAMVGIAEPAGFHECVEFG